MAHYWRHISFVCIAIVTSLMMNQYIEPSTSFIQTPTGTTLSSKLIIDVTKIRKFLTQLLINFQLQMILLQMTRLQHAICSGKMPIQDQSGISIFYFRYES